MFAVLAVLIAWTSLEQSGGYRYSLFAISSPPLDFDATLLACSSAADHSEVPDTPRRAQHDQLIRLEASKLQVDGIRNMIETTTVCTIAVAL